jgi:hypothetical protein
MNNRNRSSAARWLEARRASKGIVLRVPNQAPEQTNGLNMQRLTALVCISLSIALSLVANAQQPTDGGIESLGNELLQDLAPQPPRQPSQPQSPPPMPQPRRASDPGEDIGQPSGSLALARVRQGMQHAETLLGNNGSDLPTVNEAGKTQQKIVDQLDQLIAELSKQCQNGQCQSSDQQRQQEPQPNERSQSKPGKPKNASASAMAASRTAARDSSDRLNQTGAKPVDKGDVEAVVKDLWGHLPERTREQMMQSFSEEFLPQYELEIEQYYRRLSEDDDHLRAD